MHVEFTSRKGGNMNHLVVIGNLGQNPEIKTSGETKIANFSIAIADFKKGEKSTLWLNATAFNKTADIIEKYTQKGSKVALEGKLQIDEYINKDNVKVKKAYILVNQVELLTSKADSEKLNNGESSLSHEESTLSDDDISDDIPF